MYRARRSACSAGIGAIRQRRAKTGKQQDASSEAVWESAQVVNALVNRFCPKLPGKVVEYREVCKIMPQYGFTAQKTPTIEQARYIVCNLSREEYVQLEQALTDPTQSTVVFLRTEPGIATDFLSMVNSNARMIYGTHGVVLPSDLTTAPLREVMQSKTCDTKSPAAFNIPNRTRLEADSEAPASTWWACSAILTLGSSHFAAVDSHPPGSCVSSWTQEHGSGCIGHAAADESPGISETL